MAGSAESRVVTCYQDRDDRMTGWHNNHDIMAEFSKIERMIAEQVSTDVLPKLEHNKHST